MKPITKLVLVLSLVCCASGVVVAQSSTPASPQPTHTPRPLQTPETPVAVPNANPADVASMDAIIAALYGVISGPAGKKRDWDRMRSLFIPGARLIPSGQRPGGAMALGSSR